jgi:hypothetical protein
VRSPDDERAGAARRPVCRLVQNVAADSEQALPQEENQPVSGRGYLQQQVERGLLVGGDRAGGRQHRGEHRVACCRAISKLDSNARALVAGETGHNVEAGWPWRGIAQLVADGDDALDVP